MGDQRALDLERRHPDAGHLEHVVAAAAESVAPVGIANVFVAGAGPVSLEGPAALAALIPVTFSGGGSIDQEFADLAVRNVATCVVHQADLVAGHWAARRAVFAIAGRIGARNKQQLGRADAAEDIDAEARLPGVADRFRQRFAG